jgi:two-component system, sensor histidine kinase YesM
MRLNGLFMKQFLFTVFIIISVSAVLTVTIVRMSEQFFIDRFSITNSKVMNQVKDSFESFHYSIVNASNNVLQNGTVKRILTDRETEYEQMVSYFNMYQQMNRIKSYLDAYEIGIVGRAKMEWIMQLTAPTGR